MPKQAKDELRKALRAARREHVAALPASMRGLVFHRPPAPLLDLIPLGAIVGLYRANEHEAPAASYAKFLFERGHKLALPRFSSRGAEMEFARFADPFEEEYLENGPYGLLQPFGDAPLMTPDVVFVPLVGFTAEGDRLGQGGGHYDRWLADHPGVTAIGLAWDCQLVENLPVEQHDHPLAAVVTPTRIYGPFA
ncbi:5-formyltetrahydrofolate cyclo-ligase [Qipengyuania sp. RANM35]|uniref:5-formyltetrahydrofolate cyclo-ligase n=1 Tax=Qipengyuania sp. RANM35 TaxID=3068635 RepID=UPI0034DB6221